MHNKPSNIKLQNHGMLLITSGSVEDYLEKIDDISVAYFSNKIHQSFYIYKQLEAFESNIKFHAKITISSQDNLIFLIIKESNEVFLLTDSGLKQSITINDFFNSFTNKKRTDENPIIGFWNNDPKNIEFFLDKIFNKFKKEQGHNKVNDYVAAKIESFYLMNNISESNLHNKINKI